MRIFTIIFCLFLSVDALGQNVDTSAKHSPETNSAGHSSSASVHAKPLLVVDAVIFKGNLKKTINPKDIASVTVLSGKEAMPLYGTAAANGAILISMKETWRIKHKRPAPPKPLIVLDGVIFKGDIRSIGHSTIASVSLLKKEYAIPLYGNAGANGAIIITTKKAIGEVKKDTIR